MYTVETVLAPNANPSRGYHAFHTIVEYRFTASSTGYIGRELFKEFVDHIALLFKTDMWCSVGAIERFPIIADDPGHGPANFKAVINHGYDSGD